MNSGDFADGCHIYGTVIEESAILQKIYQKQENYFTGCFRYLKKEKEYLHQVAQSKDCLIIFYLLQKKNIWMEKCFPNIFLIKKRIMA